MSELTNRVTRLEEEAEANTRPAIGWANFWATLRLCYGDRGHYTAEELAALNSVDPEPRYSQMLKRVYGERAAKKAQSDEPTDKSR